jgi:putative membrane protein
MRLNHQAGLYPLLLIATPAWAHGETLIDRSSGVFIPLLLVAALYAVGAVRSRGSGRRSGHVCFGLGMLLLAGALTGPLENAAHHSLAAHMSQHMLLMAAAPPLLLLARPLPVLLRALPAKIRRAVALGLASFHDKAAHYPGGACLLHGSIIWGWHFPAPYQAAIETSWLHHLEHAAFLFSALWFWWTLIASARLGGNDSGGGAVLALVTLMHTGLLGALLTFAPLPLYPDHPTGFLSFGRLADQQLAGLIMWVPGGFIYLVTAVVLSLLWLRRVEQKDRFSFLSGREEIQACNRLESIRAPDKT